MILHIVYGVVIGILFQIITLMLLENGHWQSISIRRKIGMALSGGCGSLLVILAALSIDPNLSLYRVYILASVGGWGGATVVDRISNKFLSKVIDDNDESNR